ncbi:MAG: hypothetical protein ABW158_04795 [Candidatus Thiodiazotropha sp. 6PDIVS]
MVVETAEIASSTMIIAGVLALLLSSLFALTNKKLWVMENDASDSADKDNRTALEKSE